MQTVEKDRKYSKRPRVIYAWNYVEWGGAQIHFLALIKEVRKHFDVVIALPKGTDEQFIGFLDAAGVSYKLFSGNVDLGPKFSVASKIMRHVTRIKSEYAMLRTLSEIGLENAIVHTDILPGQSLFSLAWLAMRAPVFLTLHNALPKVQKWRIALWKFKYSIISRFDNLHVFCTNEHAAAYFRQLFTGRVAADIKITYDSINPEEIDEVLRSDFDRTAELERFNIPTDKFVVLAVGQFVDRKGRWTFLEAARSIRNLTDEIRFVWVAPNTVEAADQLKIDSYELGDAFFMLKSNDVGTDRLSILRFFRVADAYALPSFVEGLPISLLEAMSLGVPGISTNVYGIPEAVINETTGLLIEPGQADELRDAILRLYHDPGLRSRLSAAGREHVTTHFDEREAARTAFSAYLEALEDKSK